MLRITVANDARGAVFKMEGKLTLDWVTEADKAWTSFSSTPQHERVLVDLCGVSFVDDAGRELLGRMHSSGAKLIGTGPMTGALVEEICGGSRPRSKWIRSALGLLFLLRLVAALNGSFNPGGSALTLKSGNSALAAGKSIIPIHQPVVSAGQQRHLNVFRKGLSR